MSDAPRVSVVMPVYDTERYVAEAVESILAQTYGDFELLAFDDGSRDRTLEMVRHRATGDARVRVFAEKHVGYVTWLNRGVELARGEFVARMDADDVSLPERFERQVRFLEEHPNVVAVGTQALYVDRDGDPIAPTDKPLDHEEIDRLHLEPGCQGSMITHPTVMMRRRVVLDAGGYRESAYLVEDLDLFLRLAERGRLSNLEEPLLHYRIHPDSLGVSKRREQLRNAARVVREARSRRGLPEVERPEQARARGGSDNAPWIVRTARAHGFFRTARKHAWCAWRSRPWSRASWRLLRLAWWGA